jgi:methyl-accepting chemotaxis protein
MRILNRMLVAFGCVVGVGIIQGAATLISVQSLNAKVEHATADPLQQVDAARSVWEAFGKANAELSTTLEGIRYRASAEAIAQFSAHIAAMQAELVRLKAARPSPEMLTSTTKAEALIEQWRNGALTLLGEKAATAIPAPHIMEKLQTGIRSGLQDLVDLARRDAEATRAEIHNHAAWTERLMIGFALFGAIIGMGVAVAAAVSLTRPMVRVQVRMRDLMDGDLTSPILDQKRGDEIGSLAQTVEFVKGTLVERNRLQEEAAAAARAAEQSRRQAEEEAIGRERTLVSQSIGASLVKLAAKDLTYRMGDDIPDAYRKLQADFNEALEEMERAIESVTASTQSMHMGTEEISKASGDLSRRTEHQAARLEETAAALDKITASVRQASEGAMQARKVVANAIADAQKGGEVVRKAVEAMGGIEKSSQQISQIIGVIDEIAFQTNLLALNAGVEAARAGDAGRGFAVVASEVRGLAQRSAEAAKEIKGLISASTAQVGQGVNLVAETGKALQGLVAKVGDINAVVLEIASGAERQAIDLREVNSAVCEMDKVTQQNAAMAEQATAVSHSLAEESTRLMALVGQFNVGGGEVQKPRLRSDRHEQAERWAA